MPATQKRKPTKAAIVSNKPLPKKRIFPFDLLPAEIKNQIYELVLVSPDPIFLVSKIKALRRILVRDVMTDLNASGARRRSGMRSYWQRTLLPSSDGASTPAKLMSMVPNLMLLNKQIYAETQPLLYSANEFMLEDTTALHTFLASIGHNNVATLKDLTINGWGYTKAHKAMNFPALTLLGGATRLERIEFNCEVSYGGASNVAKQLYRDGHLWFEARGLAAVDVMHFAKAQLSYTTWRRGNAYAEEKQESSVDVRVALKKFLNL